MALSKDEIASLLGDEKPKGEGASEEEGPDADGDAPGLDTATDEAMQALEAKDAQGFKEAMRSFFQLLQKE